MVEQQELRAERPDFVHQYTRDIEPATILAIESLSLADVVIIEAGYENGYRGGMPCTVFRAGRPIAEILLVEVRPQISAATIESLVPGYSIEPGDRIRPRISRS